MPIIGFRETWRPQREASLDENGTRTYTRQFLVQMDSIAASALEVTAGTGSFKTPAIGDFYVTIDGDFDKGARCRSIKPVQDQTNPFMWTVTCDYIFTRRRWQRAAEDPTSKAGSGQQKGDQSETDPLQDKPDISWGTAKFQRPVLYDANGKAIVMSNGESPIPAYMRDDARDVLTIVKNLPSYDRGTYKVYRDAVNSADWILGIKAFTAKCDAITAVSVFDRNKWFWKTTFVFHIKEFDPMDPRNVPAGSPWDLAMKDEGTFQLDANNMPAIMKDQKTGAPITSKANLDGNGHQAAQNAAAKWNLFQIYDHQDFNNLPVP